MGQSKIRAAQLLVILEQTEQLKTLVEAQSVISNRMERLKIAVARLLVTFNRMARSRIVHEVQSDMLKA